MSLLDGVQYCEGISSVLWREPTNGDHHYTTDCTAGDKFFSKELPRLSLTEFPDHLDSKNEKIELFRFK